MNFPSYQTLCLCIMCMSLCNLNANGALLNRLVKRFLGYYTAAVFELAKEPSLPKFGRETIRKNLGKYETAAETASKYDVDIIVFPEKGIYPHENSGDIWYLRYAEDIPDPRREQANPCNQKTQFQNQTALRKLSCMAQKHNMFLVAGLVDVKTCEVRVTCNEYNIDYCTSNSSNCPKNGKLYFNTLVAFNREGSLLTRYHKRHPYFEGGITASKDPKTFYFDTDFGRFATDICFDLLFEDTVEGLRKTEATGLVFPSWWFDHTPFVYFATAYQQAWSITNKVNVIAADVQYPPTGTLGSGIYSPESGALIYSQNPDGRSKLLISNVPKSPSNDKIDMFGLNKKFFYIDNNSVIEYKGKEPRSFRRECGINVLGNTTVSPTDYRCHQTEVHQYTFIKLTEKKAVLNNCSNGFCCYLTYQASSMEEDYYFGVSGNPLNFYNTYLFGIQACFLARCEPVDGLPCRNFILQSNTIFQNVIIRGNFTTQQIYPFAIDSNIRLVEKEHWIFDRKSQIKYQNSKKNSSLLFLGLYGRKYEKDKEI